MRAPPSALIICLLAPTVALAQDNPNPLSTFNRTAYGAVKNILLHSAEKMPEENYSFKPTDAVRSYGQIIGYLNDAQYMFCSIELGEKNLPKLGVLTANNMPDLEHYGNFVTYMRLKNVVRDSSQCHRRGSNAL